MFLKIFAKSLSLEMGGRGFKERHIRILPAYILEFPLTGWHDILRSNLLNVENGSGIGNQNGSSD